MKHGTTAFLAAAALALSGAMAARATPPGSVDLDAVLEGMPRALSAYGFFADGPAQMPGKSVYPYELNTPLFSDGADKLRFVYVPPGKSVISDADGLLQFPVGTALIKTFAFGEGDEKKLIETRVLLHRAEGWVALPYRWNEAQTEARLALAGGRLDMATPSGEAISYRIPNKNQCKQCHAIDDTVVPIGPKSRNLSGEWLEAMVQRGTLDSVPDGHDVLPDWADRKSASLDDAARAYLDVNCAHCHQPGGKASNSGLDLRWEQDDPTAVGVLKRPVAAGRGSGGLEFSILPGDPDNSILHFRMNSTDPGIVMPEIGTASIDHEGLDIVRQWIAEMKR